VTKSSSGQSAKMDCRECDHEENAPDGVCTVRHGSDGLPVRCVGEWSKEKHFYLQQYIGILTTAMRKRWPGLCYIDLFAGPGRCRVWGTGDEIDGSPLIALKARSRFDRYIFVELDSECLQTLKARAASFPELRDRIAFIPGDCNREIEKVVHEIPKGFLCLAFIDPTGLQFHYTTLHYLVKNRKLDLINVYPEGMSLKRNIAKFMKAKKETPLDRYMGDRAWRELYEAKLSASGFEPAVREVAGHYRARLQELGYKWVTLSEGVTVRMTGTNVPLYLLLFASKHKRGHDFWQKITARERSGQRQFRFREVGPSYHTSHSRSTGKLSAPNIVYKSFSCLDGRTRRLVEKVNDGSIITRFAKTPRPTRPNNVVCPHFLELKWGYGCPYNCSWCYLKGTFRFRPYVFGNPVFKDRQKIERHVRGFLEQVTTPEILNAGEIADSLMFEGTSDPFSKFIVPLFESQDRHKVLFVTKSPNVQNLLALKSHKQVIVSFSLNAVPVARKWEKAPAVTKRIEAAKKLFKAGYEVRVRIDPMVPIPQWSEHYLSLLALIFDSFTPERVTLGSLRGLQSTINGCSDKSWTLYLDEGSNWGKRIASETRLQMYSTLITELREQYNFRKVALCKETLAMWKGLGADYRSITCNCVW
jgi:spore photoproduct lyase